MYTSSITIQQTSMRKHQQPDKTKPVLKRISNITSTIYSTHASVLAAEGVNSSLIFGYTGIYGDTESKRYLHHYRPTDQ